MQQGSARRAPGSAGGPGAAMPLTQASAGASCACRKRPHDGQQGREESEHACGDAECGPAVGGKRQQPAAGGDSRAGAVSVAQSAASAAQPQQEQQPVAEAEAQRAAEPQREQQGAAPPAAAQDADQQAAAELPPPPPKLKPRRPFAPRSFYSSKAAGSNDAGGGGSSSSLPSRPPSARELYLETQVHRLLLAAKAREASWKEAAARHGPGAQLAPDVFETYPTQQPAFDRADSLWLDVFSGELGCGLCLLCTAGDSGVHGQTRLGCSAKAEVTRLRGLDVFSKLYSRSRGVLSLHCPSCACQPCLPC